MGNLWSEEEIKFLIDLYVNKGLSKIEICPLFMQKHERTCESIWIKIKRLKLKHTNEQTKKIKQRLLSGENNPMYGKKSPNNGLTKNNSERIKIAGEKISKTRKQLFLTGILPSHQGQNNPMYGKKSWNNGLTKLTDERIKNYGIKNSISKKNEWEIKTEDEKKTIIKRLNDAMIQTKKPTKIELKIKNLLDELKIKYKKNYPLNGFLCDFFLLDYNFVIECDGDYWHGNPLFYKKNMLNDIQLKNNDRDRRKNLMLIENSIEFVRFWEYDIHKNYEIVKKTILMKLNLVE